MNNTYFQAILDEITDDLETQAGIILTPSQLRELQQTNQLCFDPAELATYNLAGIKVYLQATPVQKRVWDCYQRLSDNTLIVTILTTARFVTIQAS